MNEVKVKQAHVESIHNVAEKEKADIALTAQIMVLEASQAISRDVGNIVDLTSETIRKRTIEKITEQMASAPEQSLLKKEIMEAVEKEYGSIVDDLIAKTIPIPRIVVQQKGSTRVVFKDFDLDVSKLDFKPVTEELLRRSLRTNESEVIGGGGEDIARDTPINIIVNELTNYPAIEYDEHAKLLYKLAEQAVEKISGQYEKEIKNIVLYHKRQIAGFIWAQMEKHFKLISSGFETPVVYPFTTIEPHNYTKLAADPIYKYTDTISPVRDIPNKIFGGFKKSCHSLYKFDSKAEKDLAVILEHDNEVIRWLRPALSQFSLYWDHNSRRYMPDFVVETKDTIYLVEIKAETNMNDAEVTEKGDAAKKYCEVATEFNLKNGGKKWAYVLIPHSAVAPNMSFSGLRK